MNFTFNTKVSNKFGDFVGFYKELIKKSQHIPLKCMDPRQYCLDLMSVLVQPGK